MVSKKQKKREAALKRHERTQRRHDVMRKNKEKLPSQPSSWSDDSSPVGSSSIYTGSSDSRSRFPGTYSSVDESLKPTFKGGIVKPVPGSEPKGEAVVGNPLEQKVLLYSRLEEGKWILIGNENNVCDIEPMVSGTSRYGVDDTSVELSRPGLSLDVPVGLQALIISYQKWKDDDEFTDEKSDILADGIREAHKLEVVKATIDDRIKIEARLGDFNPEHKHIFSKQICDDFGIPYEGPDVEDVLDASGLGNKATIYTDTNHDMFIVCGNDFMPRVRGIAESAGYTLIDVHSLARAGLGLDDDVVGMVLNYIGSENSKSATNIYFGGQIRNHLDVQNIMVNVPVKAKSVDSLTRELGDKIIMDVKASAPVARSAAVEERPTRQADVFCNTDTFNMLLVLRRDDLQTGLRVINDLGYDSPHKSLMSVGCGENPNVYGVMCKRPGTTLAEAMAGFTKFAAAMKEEGFNVNQYNHRFPITNTSKMSPGFTRLVVNELELIEKTEPFIYVVFEKDRYKEGSVHLLAITEEGNLERVEEFLSKKGFEQRLGRSSSFYDEQTGTQYPTLDLSSHGGLAIGVWQSRLKPNSHVPEPRLMMQESLSLIEVMVLLMVLMHYMVEIIDV